MLAIKWNYEKDDYVPYRTPSNWDCKLFADLNEKINCAQCGKKIKFGDSYTSLEIHNEIGLGYPVCEKCYDVEWQRRIMSKKGGKR